MKKPDLWKMCKDQEWFVVANDLAGGWAIANAPLPLSQLDFQNDQQFGIADFLDRQTAQHIVELHNEELRADGTL